MSIAGHGVTYAYKPGTDLAETTTYRHGTATKLTVSRGYDRLQRLTSIAAQPSASALRQRIYEYSKLHKRTKAIEENGDYLSYAYDSRGGLEEAKRYEDDLFDASKSFAYTFDVLGNRQTAQELGQTSSYTEAEVPGLNQYKSYAGRLGSQSFTYDLDGNLETRGGWVFKWDAENRLKTAYKVFPQMGDRSFDFTYDHRGQRVAKVTACRGLSMSIGMRFMRAWIGLLI